MGLGRTARAVLVPVLVAGLLSVGGPAVASEPTTADGADDPVAVPFVVGGTATSNPGYIAALLRANDSDPFTAHFCGGSLIRRDVILTAAHCVDGRDPGDVDVAVGFTLLSSISAEDRLDVAQISIHPDWTPGEVYPTDIALLRLTEPIWGLPLVPVERDPAQPSLLRPLVVAGWGFADPFRTVSLDALQSAAVLSLTSVDHSLEEANDLCGVRDTSDDFCLGGSTTGICQGDSGGPVLGETFAGSGVFEVTGIVSYGPSSQCLHPSRFDGGQRISPYLGWLTSVLDLWNGPPSVSADKDTVVVDEGQLATISGTFADVEGDDVIISASVGTIDQDAGDVGQWFWSYGPTDGPTDSGTVTITGSDGETTVTTFDLIVENVAPSVHAGPDRIAYVDNVVRLDEATFTDPGTGDTHTASVDWGESTTPSPLIVSGAAGSGTVAGSHVYASAGSYTVDICVADDDGGEACDDTTIRVMAVTCPNPTPPFTDISPTSFARTDIACLYGLGITNGTSPTTFDPTTNITREQTAALIARMIRAL